MNKKINKIIDSYLTRDVVRFVTCGSVDDGKSTLIGRLLFENNCLYEDQLKALEKISKGRGITDDKGKEIDYSLLLDGLQAEIEQGITIDVAYRYFSTSKRNYIVADSPGHEQYTRNMATAASTADLALLLLDASKGFLKQTKRHLYITSLMGIKNFIVAVNKMDTVGYKKEVFEECKKEYSDYVKHIKGKDNFTVKFIPVSALKGDNISFQSKNMSWYRGETLVAALDNFKIINNNSDKFRFLVKYVERPNSDFRSYCGLVASGNIKKGDEVVVLPSGQVTKIDSIYRFKDSLPYAQQGDSVCLTVRSNIDISRGDLITKTKSTPKLSNQVKAEIIWMDEDELLPNTEYYIKFNNRLISGRFETNCRYNIESSSDEPAESLRINEIGNARVFFDEQIPVDAFEVCKETGSFIIINKLTNRTSGAGIVSSVSGHLSDKKNSEVYKFETTVSKQQRADIKNQKPCVVWMTGLSGSGKSTIGNGLELELLKLGYHTFFLDGDNLRSGLNKDIGFSDKSRSENIRRAAEVSRLMLDAGLIVITAFISPFEKDRKNARKIIGKDNFLQIFIDTPLEECIKRDPKNLYKKAMTGAISDFTGIGSQYEIPKSNDLIVKTLGKTPEESIEKVLEFVLTKVKS